MEITVNEFLNLAVDVVFNICVFDYAKGKNIFENWKDAELPETIGDMLVVNWNLNENPNRIELNVDSDEE